MKRLTLILGDPNPLHNFSTFFKHFQKEFGVYLKLHKGVYYKLYEPVIIEGIEVEFFGCYNPTRDANYNNVKEFFLKNKWGLIQPPADEICKEVKSTDVVLFVGTCGAFKGFNDEIYIPAEFREIDFKDSKITEENILHPMVSEPIHLNNFLVGKIKGKKGKVVSTNLTFAPLNIDGNPKESIRKLAFRMLKSADVVEKETYQVVKGLGNKFPLGILLIVSDVISKPELMMVNKMHHDSKHFAQTAVNAIKSLLVDLKDK